MLGHGVLHAREPARRLAGSLVGRELLLACWAAATALGWKKKRFGKKQKIRRDRSSSSLLLVPRLRAPARELAWTSPSAGGWGGTGQTLTARTGTPRPTAPRDSIEREGRATGAAFPELGQHGHGSHGGRGWRRRLQPPFDRTRAPGGRGDQGDPPKLI